MAEDDVALKLFDLVGRDDAVFEGPKAGSDAVGHLAACEQSLNRLRGAGYVGLRRFAKRDRRLVWLAVGHGDNLVDGEALAVKKYRIHSCF